MRWFTKSLSISHKGAIVVLTPLVLELAFVFVLASALRHSEQDTEAAFNARMTIERGNELIFFAALCETGIGGYVMTGHPRYLAMYDAYAPKFSQVIAELTETQKNDKEQLRKLLAVTSISNQFFAELEAEKALMPDHQEEAKQKVTHSQAGLHLRQFAEQMDQFLKAQETIAQHCRQAHTNSRNALNQAIVYGVCGNIMFAVILSIYFGKGITGRLRIMTDNTLRLTQGKPLHPVLTGNDEVASLDQVFHQMSAALTETRVQLLANEERVRNMVENMPLGIIETNQDGMVEYANPRFCTMTLNNDRDLSGARLKDLLPHLADLNCASAGTNSTDSQVLTVPRSDNSSFPAEILIQRFNARSGEKVLVSVLDITERDEVERLKQEFVAMLTHDLKTPVTSIQLFLQFLSNHSFGNLPETAEKTLGAAERSVERLLNLINDLLDFEKMESGMMELHFAPTNLKDIVEQSREAVTMLADQQEITIEIQPVDVQLVADEERLIRVFVNLLTNAVKFSPRSSKVIVKCTQSSDSVEVRITDQGRGIPVELLDAVFDKYRQVELADARKHKGTGLGLPICKTIVELHKGQIGVESRNGDGTTFWFRIPLTQQFD